VTPGIQARNLIAELITQAEPAGLLLQGCAMTVALLLAWGISETLRRGLHRARENPDVGNEALRFGAAGLDRILLPVLGWAFLVSGRGVLRWYHQPTTLLDIAVPLLSSLVIVRTAVYMLRHAFPSGSWVRKSETAIAWTVWVLMVLHITAVLPGIRVWLDEVRLPIGRHDISLLNVIEGTLSVGATMVAAVWLGRTVEQRLMAFSPMDVSLRVVFSKLLRAVFIILGVLVALTLVGIDVTVLSVFGGALGVGLGFGLQKIAANYVSGFVILLDRSIKLGDLVTIDNRYGEVTRLTVRYVVVKSLDGTENIIPNETIITSTVVNHSYSDRQVRIDGAIQVAYSADVGLALQTLLDVARGHPRVLSTPEPIALVRGFGENGVDLEFFVWIRDPEAGRANLRSDLNLKIFNEFRARGIEIPFPQRDVRIVGEKRPPMAPGLYPPSS
jgi:small-conductance mechanosensitive channel